MDQGDTSLLAQVTGTQVYLQLSTDNHSDQLYVREGSTSFPRPITIPLKLTSLYVDQSHFCHNARWKTNVDVICAQKEMWSTQKEIERQENN